MRSSSVAVNPEVLSTLAETCALDRVRPISTRTSQPVNQSKVSRDGENAEAGPRTKGFLVCWWVGALYQYLPTYLVSWPVRADGGDIGGQTCRAGGAELRKTAVASAGTWYRHLRYYPTLNA